MFIESDCIGNENLLNDALIQNKNFQKCGMTLKIKSFDFKINFLKILSLLI